MQRLDTLTNKLPRPATVLLGSVTAFLLLKALSYYKDLRKPTSKRKQPKERRAHQREISAQPDGAVAPNAPTQEVTTDCDPNKALMALLYNIGEDQSRKEGYVHRSITCNHCGTSPIRGFRFKCANCVDFDLCEQCDALLVHNKNHVFIKIGTPIPPLANPRSALVPVLYPGKPFPNNTCDWEKIKKLQAKTHFDHVELDAFWDQYESLSTVNIESGQGGITKETFCSCLGPLGLETNLITERVFRFFDSSNDGIIDFEEFVTGLGILCKGSFEERSRHAFAGYDLNEDGYITEDELQKMFRAYFRLSMELVRDVVKTMEEGMMESFDDEAAKPVSAAFSAPIPSSSTHPSDIPDLKTEQHQQQQRKPSGALLKSPKQPPVSGGSLAIPSVRINTGTLASPSTNSQHASSSTASHTRTAPLSAGPILGSTLALPMSPVAASSLHAYGSLASPGFNDAEPGSNPLSPSLLHYPAIESISQEAIQEMVENIFQLAGSEAQRSRRLDFAEFKELVAKDPSLLGWIEALGSVF